MPIMVKSFSKDTCKIQATHSDEIPPEESIYIVQKCKYSAEKDYDCEHKHKTKHGSLDGYSTMCGLRMDENYCIVMNVRGLGGSHKDIACKKCLKKLKEIGDSYENNNVGV